MRLSLVGLNLLALGALMGAAWLIYNATQTVAPIPEMGRNVLFGILGAGSFAMLIAVVQFSRRRRMNAWGAITPMVIGSLLIIGGFAWLILNATFPR